MNKPVLLIHGWGDSAESFDRLGHLIAENLQRSVDSINIADYVSLDDSVTMDDLVSALEYAWRQRNLSRAPFSVDVVVHSTGGLIIRDWITRYFKPDEVPIKNLLMLAPANFGSPLAQKGQALIGRITVGLESKKLFQTGQSILKALELASPYSWDLAFRDRFADNQYYGPRKILCTVLVGNEGFRGIRAAANEPGMDGAVRISTANLNAVYCEINYVRDELKPTVRYRESTGITAFGILLGENHNSLVAKEGGPANPDTLHNIFTALTITDEGFAAWCDNLAYANTFVMEMGKADVYKQGYQTIVCCLVDQYHRGIDDYFLEFYSDCADNDALSDFFHSAVIHSVHAYSEQPSYRSLLVNCVELQKLLAQGYTKINVGLTATPTVGGVNVVGYHSYGQTNDNGLTLNLEEIHMAFQANRTLLVKIKIPRIQSSSLLRIRELQ